jgi:amino-acid N-acetyltransferase
VLGCGALRIYNESLAEVASLAVEEHAHGRGIGRRSWIAWYEDARDLGLATVFALTLQEASSTAPASARCPKEMFPLKVWADCRTCPKLHACDEIAVARDV